ncbi:hypothetical protein ACLUTX_28945 [Enterobacterales bacterium AE_CKDN230030158-1A_HGKHYDSX7]
MSRKRAKKLEVVYEFPDGAERVSAVQTVMNLIAQWGFLYITGNSNQRRELRPRLREVAEACLAWQCEEEQNARNGIASTAASRELRQPEWDRWQARAEELFAANPNLSKSAICNRVAKEFGVSPRSVRRRVSNVGRPRKTD